MKLIDLVEYLREPKLLNTLSTQFRLQSDLDEWLIYMKESISIDSEIVVFDTDESDDDLIFEKDGIKYVQLFAVDHAVDLIHEDLDLNKKSNSNSQIAARLIEYRINDA